MPYANINLEGRLVCDPEFRVGKGDREYCTFRVVVNQQLGAQENASFYNCTGNEVIASRIRKAGLVKGRLIHVNGELALKDYQTRDHETRTSADVSINNWHFVGVKPKTDEQKDAGAPAPSQQGTVNQETYVGDEDDLPL